MCATSNPALHCTPCISNASLLIMLKHRSVTPVYLKSICARLAGCRLKRTPKIRNRARPPPAAATPAAPPLAPLPVKQNPAAQRPTITTGARITRRKVADVELLKRRHMKCLACCLQEGETCVLGAADRDIVGKVKCGIFIQHWECVKILRAWHGWKLSLCSCYWLSPTRVAFIRKLYMLVSHAFWWYIVHACAAAVVLMLVVQQPTFFGCLINEVDAICRIDSSHT